MSVSLFNKATAYSHYQQLSSTSPGGIFAVPPSKGGRILHIQCIAVPSRTATPSSTPLPYSFSMWSHSRLKSAWTWIGMSDYPSRSYGQPRAGPLDTGTIVERANQRLRHACHSPREILGVNYRSGIRFEGRFDVILIPTCEITLVRSFIREG